MALPKMSNVGHPMKRYGLDKTSVRFEICLLYNMASHSYSYKYGARMLWRPYAADDLEAQITSTVPLPCFVAL